MGHSVDVKEKAFSFWCQGLSFDDIGAELDKAKTHVNRKTLLRWKKNEGWDVRRQEVVGRVKEATDANVTQTLQSLAKEVSKLKDRVFRELQSAPAPKSLTGGVIAYTMLLDRLMKLMPTEAAGGDAGEVIKKVLDVLFKHPKVGVVLEKYREDILGELNKALAQGTKEPRNQGIK